MYFGFFDLMKLHIKNRAINEIQDEFHRAYPFLKIEFFDKTYGYRRISGENPLYVRRSAASPDDEIVLPGNTTVRGLEQELQGQLGLSAQVFRRSGNIWMETIGSDDWTLDDQNEHGREISSPGRNRGQNKRLFNL
jgi:hypothetical protein